MAGRRAAMFWPWRRSSFAVGTYELASRSRPGAGVPSFVVSSLAKGIAAMSSSTDQRVDCFSVFSAADPSALLRILEAVSLLGVLPSRCHSAPLETDPGQLVVDLQIAGLPSERAQQLAKRLKRVITVTQVLHSQKRCAAG
jgi:hypothetical protein